MKRHLKKHFSNTEALKTLVGGIALFLATSPVMWLLSTIIESLL
jgi:hypothetical protein